jgi:hypothetical protein
MQFVRWSMAVGFRWRPVAVAVDAVTCELVSAGLPCLQGTKREWAAFSGTTVKIFTEFRMYYSTLIDITCTPKPGNEMAASGNSLLLNRDAERDGYRRDDNVNFVRYPKAWATLGKGMGGAVTELRPKPRSPDRIRHCAETRIPGVGVSSTSLASLQTKGGQGEGYVERGWIATSGICCEHSEGCTRTPYQTPCGRRVLGSMG